MAKSNLQTLLETLMGEDNMPPQPEHADEVLPVESQKDFSLDQVVDRYLIRYEKESIPTSDTYQDELYGESYKSVIDRTLMLEAPGDEEPLDAGEPPPGGEEMEGGEEEGSTTPEKPIITTPRINLQDFARSAARLVNNYDVLLNPREIILNRIEQYMIANYDARTAKELMDILETNYSLSTVEREEETQEDFPTPYAAGALSTE